MNVTKHYNILRTETETETETYRTETERDFTFFSLPGKDFFTESTEGYRHTVTSQQK